MLTIKQLAADTSQWCDASNMLQTPTYSPYVTTLITWFDDTISAIERGFFVVLELAHRVSCETPAAGSSLSPLLPANFLIQILAK
jgi:hypothetical protein